MSKPWNDRKLLRRIWTGPLAAAACACALLVAAGSSGAWAFDYNGFKQRAEATLAELNTKRLTDSKSTLARLDEMIALGVVGMKEYAATHPKYAKLMDAAIADVPT